MGQIGIGYTELDTQKKIRFKMNVGFGSRVLDYDLEGSDGLYRAMFQKSMIISALEQTFSK